MKLLADAVAAKFANDREAMLFSVLLNGMPNIAECGFRLNRTDSKVKGFLADIAQPAGSDWNVPNQKHLAGIAVVAILDDRNINVDNVATF